MIKWLFGGSKKYKKSKERSNGSRQSPSSGSNQRVISYYTASRRQLDNFERSKANDSHMGKRRLRLKESWFAIVCAVVLVIVLGYSAILDTTPHIIIQGQSLRTAGEYQKLIGAVFGHDIRNQFKPTLQAASLTEAVRAVVPEASQVSVTTDLLGHRPTVKITTDTPLAIFNQPGSTDLVLSDRGRLLLPSVATNFNINDLPLIQNQTGVTGEAGQQFMRPDEAQAFARLLAQFKADNSVPIFTLSLTPHELLARESGRGLSYNERFLLKEDITLQYGALRAAQKKLNETGQAIAEYIDIRLVERIFYR